MNRLVLILLTFTSVIADCGPSDYQTIIGESRLYNVISIASDISPTTNDNAVGIVAKI